MSPASRRPGVLRVFDRWVLPATVVGVADLAARMRRVTVQGAALEGLDWLPGQSTRVVFNDLTRLRHWTSLRDLRDATRCYSIWAYDPPAGRLDLVVYRHHHDGPGARWIERVGPGDPVLMFPIEGRLVARPRAPYHLFVGDETAAVCFGAILRGLRDDAPVFGAIEAAAPAARLPLPRGDRLTRIERDDDAAPSPSAALVDAVRGLELPPGPGAAYLAGEAKTVQAVRRHLIHDRGWSRTDIRAKAFWAPGKRGLD